MRIKINWGTAMVIVMISFMIFILQYVFRTLTVDKYKYELVSEDYYKDELYYQKEIDKLNKANKLAHNVTIEYVSNGLLIIFPSDLDFRKINGTIYFIRPSDQKLDFKMSILLKDNKLQINNDQLRSGRWNVKIDWMYDNEAYLYKDSLFY
jgi:hypothetical protein